MDADNPDELVRLAEVALQNGSNEQAAELLRRLLALRPELAEAHYNLGIVLQSLGQLEEAGQSYWRALALRPGFAVAHNNLGNVLGSLGRQEEAERSIRQALALDPDYAEAHNNLGNALASLARQDEAELSYRRALALKPGLAEAHYNLGVTLESAERLEEAESCFRQALALKPSYADAYYDLGNVLGRLDRLQESEHSYRQALALRPDFPEALAQWVHKRQWLCDWSGLDGGIQAMRRHVADGKPGLYPFTFLALPGTTAGEQHACARIFVEKMFSASLSRPPLHKAAPRPDRSRLRIGYLSGDFREHPASYLLSGVIEHHNRQRFEVFGYSYGRDDGSAIGRRIRGAFDTLTDIRNASNESAARKIAGDEVDILVELTGYTAGARMEIAALRPAPIQVSGIGYPGTIGHPRLADYVIGDPIATPLEHAAHYAEALALMPFTYQPNDRRRPMAKSPARIEAGLPGEGFVFCCFNQSYKITPSIFDLWCRLLREVPHSFLWLTATSQATVTNLAAEAAARGLAPQRILFAPRLPLDGHLARLKLADLALDTSPYGSHSTASDALWAGVPLVALQGSTQVSRLSASILGAAGLPELVASDPDSYFRLAFDLAMNPVRLAELQSKLEAKRMICPLFDDRRFAADLEYLFTQMWVNYLAGRKTCILPRQT